jgi:hypothetical protein
MLIRLYLDEDAMARSLVSGLRARGINVTTVVDEGMSERSDLEQLEFGTKIGRSIYTFNVGHFCNLHTEFCYDGKKSFRNHRS